MKVQQNDKECIIQTFGILHQLNKKIKQVKALIQMLLVILFYNYYETAFVIK
jgi:hypothetical protein